MNANISRWILDFLLRQSLDDRILDNLIRVLPLDIHDSTLKKAMLVRKLVSEISKGMATEEMLILMERIEELDFQAGVTASEAIQAAYCHVAVDCTVRLLEEESQDREVKYSNAVKRIWRGRVLMMETAENVGLVSNELIRWRDDIEASLRDASVYDHLLKKWRGCEALKSVRVYVAEAWVNMGPSFLEQVVQTVGSDQITQLLKHSTCPVNDQDQDQDQDQNLSPIQVQEMEKRRVLPTRMQVFTRRGRGANSDSDSQDGRAASENDLVFTPQVTKLQEALKVSCKELQAAVKDPLPEAIQLADKVISGLVRDGMNQRCPVEERHTVVGDAEKNLSTDKGCGANAVNVNETKNDNKRKPCLMEKNSTARVYEWDDSLDDDHDVPSNGNGLHLRTPSAWQVSPLNKYRMGNLGRRRIKKKWSTSEEDALRAGVEKYGKGNWKFILDVYKDIFDERTGADLKDKWRNMTRVSDGNS